MEPPPPQLSLTSLLLLVACVALNLWLFSIGPLWGILGISVTKHLLVAVLCKLLGLDRRTTAGP